MVPLVIMAPPAEPETSQSVLFSGRMKPFSAAFRPVMCPPSRRPPSNVVHVPTLVTVLPANCLLAAAVTSRRSSAPIGAPGDTLHIKKDTVIRTLLGGLHIKHCVIRTLCI